jgi:hypothetical protein
MNHVDRMIRIEMLTRPNELKGVEMPELDLIGDETILQCRERQLSKTLRSLDLAECDRDNNNDIIKQWRANSGFTLNDSGDVVYTPLTPY